MKDNFHLQYLMKINFIFICVINQIFLLVLFNVEKLSIKRHNFNDSKEHDISLF